MAQQISRKNHYVPVWYQWRFFSKNSNKLFCLNLTPHEQLPDGRIISFREVSELSPSSCFCKQDLYTTQFGEILNDEIERFLMGVIDTEGAAAVSAKDMITVAVSAAAKPQPLAVKAPGDMQHR